MTTTFKVTNGDVVVSAASGQPVLLADGIKVRQDIREALSTARRQDNIGASLDELVGRPSDVFVIRADLTSRVRASITRMQDLQARFQLSLRPLNERVSQLTRLDVTPIASAGTAFSFRAEITTVAGSTQVVTGSLE